MFARYNGIMRMSDDELAKTENKFPTTIHILQSLLQKLSRVSAAPENRKVYRGMSRLRLPPQFFEKDRQGCRCGAIPVLRKAPTPALTEN